MPIHRRRFLKRCGAGLLGGFLFTHPLFASRSCRPKSSTWGEEEPHFFVHLNFKGGWSCLASFDPRTPEMIRSEDPQSDVNDYHFRWDENQAFLRPFLENSFLGPGAWPLLKHQNDLALVRGVLMGESIDHPSNRCYMGSGSREKDTIFGVHQIFETQALTHGTRGRFGVAQHLQDEKNFFSGPVPTVKLQNLADMSAGKTMEMESFWLLQRKCERWQNDPNYQEFAYAAAEAGYSPEITQAMARIRPELERLIPEEGLNDEVRQWITLAASLLSGASLQAYIDVPFTPIGRRKDLDSHTNYFEEHIPMLSSGCERVSYLFDLFKHIEVLPGRSLFDCTTFLGTSEFSRTPWAEVSEVRDREGDHTYNDGTAHNPFLNAAFFAGKNIRGGKVIGQSHFYGRASMLPVAYGKGLDKKDYPHHYAALFDFDRSHPLSREEMLILEPGLCLGQSKSGVSCVDFIRPQNVWETVYQAMNLKNPGTYVSSALSIPGWFVRACVRNV